MRILVDHRTTYRYDTAASDIVQAFRLTPPDHDAQHVRRWRIEVDVDGRMREGVDPFGNRLHMFYPDRPAEAVSITVTGEVDVEEAAGVVRGAPDPLPAPVYLRQTNLTRPDDAIRALAEGVRRADLIPMLHDLNLAIHRGMRFDPRATGSATPAADALALGQGVCQDFAHIFCAAARLLDVPARYVSGHLAHPDDRRREAAHAWAEALVPDLGWVAFDPANGLCATERHLRVAVGLDYLDAAPVRGARRGGGTERLEVAVAVAGQWQRQSQG